MFNKVVRPNRIYQEVADQIEDHILSGKLVPGERLPAERNLSETLNISRRTLRESLRVLEQKGLIEICTTGTFVKVTTTEKLSQSLGLAIKSKQISWEDIVQFRSEIEGIVARKAAKLATERDIAKLEEIIKKIEDLTKDDKLDWDSYIELDISLHLILAKTTGNRIYGIILRTILDNLAAYFQIYRSNEDAFSLENLKNLKSIVDAVKRGDENSTQEAILEHFKIGSAYLKKGGGFKS
ncbi:GntR family transcriptional regulator [Desulfosarcina widdelii]|uniref:GntR family transcriptional regulator n=1 Tax=Desulfosarcina widdelii TaxID=947919 RepID=A0A5K7YX91_9BACT|nr:FadR/GntR family transcriptional regulator [Desulfosarcina widdelii]BBO73238.1 GntR family transcriptional regulator [Desulfosarcina widdelii]